MRRPNKQRRNDDNFGKSGLKVEVRNGDFNAALRRFKKKVQEAGIIQEVRERKEYVKLALLQEEFENAYACALLRNTSHIRFIKLLFTTILH